MHKLRENAEKELKMIEEKGLTTSNLDNAFKLVEIVKGVDKINMMEDGGYSRSRGYSRDREDYSHDGYSMDDYDNGNSYRRGRSSRTGRYVSRDSGTSLAGDDDHMSKYRMMKQEYSQSRDGRSKEKMLNALEDAAYYVCDWIKQACKDANCSEEREILMKPVEEMYFYLKDMAR